MDRLVGSGAWFSAERLHQNSSGYGSTESKAYGRGMGTVGVVVGLKGWLDTLEARSQTAPLLFCMHAVIFRLSSLLLHRDRREKREAVFIRFTFSLLLPVSFRRRLTTFALLVNTYTHSHTYPMHVRRACGGHIQLAA